ncbi:hypothetical protein [Streptomyces sp. HSG2]|uniref:hypothetical protein n=1 Tax=Streptomyces sp. HSG2 TaxID=2797167 RepID=UPI0019062283|nr:hypothetical protein [Streptomyces sp. HSG2]
MRRHAHTAARAIRHATTGSGAVGRLALGLLAAGTLLSQHENTAFARLAQRDVFQGMFPNWRFFAPNPAQHDFHLHYRTLGAADDTSPWTELEIIQPRRPRQVAWFPERRAEKGVFDVSAELTSVLHRGFAHAALTPAYRTLAAFLRAEVGARCPEGTRGLQFTLTRAGGHDPSVRPEIVFVSPLVPLSGPTADTTRKAATPA